MMTTFVHPKPTVGKHGAAKRPAQTEEWIDWAAYESTGMPGNYWYVQISTKTGAFRCHCPAYIWRKNTPCPHCTLAAADADKLGAPRLALAHARTLLLTILASAGVQVTADQYYHMANTLACSVAASALVPLVPLAGPVPDMGVRVIRFDGEK